MTEFRGYMVRPLIFRCFVGAGVLLPLASLVSASALTIASGVVAIAAALAWLQSMHLAIRAPTEEELKEMTSE